MTVDDPTSGEEMSSSPQDEGPDESTASLVRITVATLGVTGVIVLSANPIVVALPSIGADLGNVALLGWVLSAYVLGSAVGLLVAGSLIDALGVRRTFRLSVLWYVAVTLACVAAPSMVVLLGLRVLQGLGSGFVQAVAFSTIALAYPPRLRPRMFAANSTLWGISGLVAPSLGTLLVGIGGWRLLLAANVPVALAAASLGWRVLPGRRPDAPRPSLDVVGVALLGLATGLLLWAFGSLSMLTPAVLVAAAVVGAAYWRHTARRAGREPGPVISRDHIVGRPSRWINVTGLLAFAVPWGLSAYVPLVAIVGLGFDPAVGAVIFTGYAGGWIGGSVVAGVAQRRYDASLLLIVGCGLMAVGAAVGTVLWTPGVPPAALVVLGVVSGLGGGITNNISITLTQAYAPAAAVGRTLSSFQYVRNFGSAAGAALTGATIFAVVGLRVGDVEQLRGMLDPAAAASVVAPVGAAEAVLVGSRWAHLVAALLGAGATWAAFSLHRWARTAETAAVIDHVPAPEVTEPAESADPIGEVASAQVIEGSGNGVGRRNPVSTDRETRRNTAPRYCDHVRSSSDRRSPSERWEQPMTRIVALVGNPKLESRTLTVAEEVAHRIADRSAGAGGDKTVKVEHIDLASLAGELFDWSSVAAGDAVEQVRTSALVVVASPVYKASFTGLLKAFLDRFPPDGLMGVAAVPVMVGAAPIHALAVETQLRPVLVELGASCPTRGLFVTESQLTDLSDVVDQWLTTAANDLPQLADHG
ncbi:MAG: MFS transporter [Acidimicrobiia bacterium]|nr:MFS transporter [Acidimicrobiia bacterium]